MAVGGLLLNGRTVEGLVGKQDTATAQATLAASGVTVAAKSLSLDLGALVSGLDPTGGFFGHDKVEGVATTDGGRNLRAGHHHAAVPVEGEDPAQRFPGRR